jgi:hypothetical protein
MGTERMSIRTAVLEKQRSIASWTTLVAGAKNGELACYSYRNGGATAVA